MNHTIYKNFENSKGEDVYYKDVVIDARGTFVQAVKNDKNHMELFENSVLVKEMITQMVV